MARLTLAKKLLLATAALASVLSAQSSGPRFEVASVKPCPDTPQTVPEGRRGDGRQSSPDRLHLTCQTLMSLIQWAYSNYADARFNPLASIPISGGPAWIGTKLFQVDAKAASPQSNGAMNGPMLRALLEERFGLIVRRDIKETPVYALTAAKGAPLRLTPSTHNTHRRRSRQAAPHRAGKTISGSLRNVGDER